MLSVMQFTIVVNDDLKILVFLPALFIFFVFNFSE